MRRRRDGSWSIVGKLGFGIDVGEMFIVRPQVHLLIGGAIADGRLRLVWRLQA